MFFVTKCFIPSRREIREKDFSRQEEAEKFIQEKLQEDIIYKVAATYGLYEGILYEGADLIEEFTQKDVISAGPVFSRTSDSSQAAGTGETFNPSPFTTTARPDGPQNWKKEREEDKPKSDS
jgi:hypothetical protein